MVRAAAAYIFVILLVGAAASEAPDDDPDGDDVDRDYYYEDNYYNEEAEGKFMGKATDDDIENSNSASIAKMPEKEEGRETKGEETSPLMVDLTSAEQLEIEEDGEYYYEDEGESELEYRGRDSSSPPLSDQDLPSLDMVLSAARDRSSTESKFLPGLTRELLDDIGDDELRDHARDVRAIASLNRTRMDVFQGLISRLPVQLSAEIASKPGILVSLTDQQITFVSMHVEILELTSSDKILELVNTRPQVVPKLSWRAVDLFIRMPSFVKSLRTDTLAFLVNSGKFAKTLEKLPRSTLALFVTENPDALIALPRNYPARKLVQRLTEDMEFLRLVPMHIHVYLAESPFRHRLRQSTVLKILTLYPMLPNSLSDKGLRYNSKYTTSQDFLRLLPCSVVMTLGSLPSFLDRLSSPELSALARSENVWRCLPIDSIRTMIRKSSVGKRLSASDVVAAARTMSTAKSLDPWVVHGLFRYQIPSMVKKSFRGLFFWQQ